MSGLLEVYFRCEGVDERENALLPEQVTKVVTREQERGMNVVVGGDMNGHMGNGSC